MKKGVQWPILLAVVMGLVVLIVVTIILRDKIPGLVDAWIKLIEGIK